MYVSVSNYSYISCHRATCKINECLIAINACKVNNLNPEIVKYSEFLYLYFIIDHLI